jgi:hypothetical protein
MTKRTTRVQAQQQQSDMPHLVKSAAKPDVSNLGSCVLDAQIAALDSDAGPADPTDFQDLRSRLDKCRDKLPPLYRDAVFDPYVGSLDKLGQQGFVKILGLLGMVWVNPHDSQMARARNG